MTCIDVARGISEEFLRKNGRWRDAASLVVSYYETEKDMMDDERNSSARTVCHYDIGSRKCIAKLADGRHISRVAILPSTPSDNILGCLEEALQVARENAKEKK